MLTLGWDHWDSRPVNETDGTKFGDCLKVKGKKSPVARSFGRNAMVSPTFIIRHIPIATKLYVFLTWFVSIAAKRGVLPGRARGQVGRLSHMDLDQG